MKHIEHVVGFWGSLIMSNTSDVWWVQASFGVLAGASLALSILMKD